MSDVWSLPGYDVQEMLGFGATGEVWRAVQLSTGETVALKRLRPGLAPAAVQALLGEAALLAGLDTPHVVRLREVVGSGADAVLVLDHVAGGSLAALLARRGSLDPGEVVTVAAPLAQALAAAHVRGLVHGDVTPSNVLFTSAGMPVLSDLGLARLAGQRGDPDAAADVSALAAVCHHMLAGAPPRDGVHVGEALSGAPRALVAAVEAGLGADPAGRPDAASFATLLRRAHAVAPVRLAVGPRRSAALPEAHTGYVVPATGQEPPGPARSRLPHGAPMVAAALVVVLLAAGAVGWASGRGSAAGAPALPPAAPAAAAVDAAVPDWVQVLDGLDAARAQAFASGDVAVLSAVYAPGSPDSPADVSLLQALVDAGRTAHGLRHAVRAVEVMEASADTARLRVVDVLGPHEVRGPDGAVVALVPARDEQAFLVELTRTADGWRLVQVRAEG